MKALSTALGKLLVAMKNRLWCGRPVELDQRRIGSPMDVDGLASRLIFERSATRVSTSSSRTMVGPAAAASATDWEKRSDTARCVLPMAELVSACGSTSSSVTAAFEKIGR